MLRGTFKAELTEQESEAFTRQVVGTGGFQKLLRDLQKAYDKKLRVVTLDGDQIEKKPLYKRLRCRRF
jgi:chromosome segregation ATPase